MPMPKKMHSQLSKKAFKKITKKSQVYYSIIVESPRLQMSKTLAPGVQAAITIAIVSVYTKIKEKCLNACSKALLQN